MEIRKEMLPGILDIRINGVKGAAVHQDEAPLEDALPVVFHTGLLHQHGHQVPGPGQGAAGGDGRIDKIDVHRLVPVKLPDPPVFVRDIAEFGPHVLAERFVEVYVEKAEAVLKDLVDDCLGKGESSWWSGETMML